MAVILPISNVSYTFLANKKSPINRAKTSFEGFKKINLKNHLSINGEIDGVLRKVVKGDTISFYDGNKCVAKFERDPKTGKDKKLIVFRKGQNIFSRFKKSKNSVFDLTSGSGIEE